MPRYADLIATMPSDELYLQLIRMKQERNRLLEEAGDTWLQWRDGKIVDGEILCKSLHKKAKQLYHKIDKAEEEHHKRVIQDMRG